MTFNPGKSEVQEVITYIICNGQNRSVVDNRKHLGVVIFSTKLSWSSNIDKVVAKARKVQVWHRTTRGANVLAKLQIYKSLVVPALKYASPLAMGSPHQERCSKPQVIVQRHVTKVTLGY